MIKCEECGGTHGAHYGSCSQVPADMRNTFAIIEQEDADRKRRISEIRAEQAATIERITADAVTRAAKAAFDPDNRREDVDRHDLIVTCAALVTFLNVVEIERCGGTVTQWRERIEALTILLRD